MADQQGVVLSVEAAVKAFGPNNALDGAEFHLNRGEWLALLGPNGAGKTTMIRAISGRVKLDGGTITLMGKALKIGNLEGRGSLGIVPQEIALYENLTASENLRAFGRMYGVEKEQLNQRIDWALDWTGLASRKRELAGTFSGGMKRRLNIAAAVLHRPSVILLDEPTVGVDPQSRQRIWDMLDTLREDGASMMLTTHQLDEAQQKCDRIVILDSGKTIEDGSLEELIARTVGLERHLIIHLEGEQEPLETQLTDIGSELPQIVQSLSLQGKKIRDLKVKTPNLQDVFLKLTGRELRE